MIKGLNLAAKSLGIEVETQKPQSAGGQADFTDEEIPMMYRAQIEGRCSLQFAGRNDDLERWREEWVDLKNGKPRYTKVSPEIGLQSNIYRIAVQFPFRLISNCGQDSIIRPIMGKNGIPVVSGSSVKGAFRRACNESQKQKYCGNEKDLAPSDRGLRFHGAYPVGDWSGSHEIKIRKHGKDDSEIRYRMLDVVHPQQERQVGSDKKQSATALASVSLYQPKMIFEFSGAALTDDDWKEVENIFWKAIALGIGGKTSTGYGLGGYNDFRPASVPNSKVSVALIGQGVSPTLRSDEPEFRPNLFKASLRGHFQRLLAGVISDRQRLDVEVNRLFGSSADIGALQLVWQQQKDVTYGDYGLTKTFKAEGILYLDSDCVADVALMEHGLQFAYVMGGFGKSWRRASHQVFHKTYKKFEIGCHWELASTDRSWLKVRSVVELKSFLEDLHGFYISKFGGGKANSLNWRESWHPDRVTVYGKVVSESSVIQLFHDPKFKTTPAIGGRIIVQKFSKKTRKMEDTEQLVFSHVWHRMLPIGDGQFLEIVTVFHNDLNAWKHRDDHENQLKRFLETLTEKGLQYVWGKQNPLQQSSTKVSIVSSKPVLPQSPSKPKPRLR